MKFEITQNLTAPKEKANIEHLDLNIAKKVNGFHAEFPNYKATPLRNLRHLASYLGVQEIYIKDESFRFGLNAFKVLGGSYAIGNYIADKLGEPIDQVNYTRMISSEVKEKVGDITFISATDGNHGRGVAWTVNALKQKSIIYMPKGSAQERLENIRAEGARAEITELNYDDAVRLADKHAKENGWVLVQDTSWEGYEKIPTHIMQGYITLGYEIFQQLKDVKPTHIFLQAGVGSFASSLTGFFANVYKENKPLITIVEPNEAACIYKTMKINDGKIHPVTGDMNTIMAGLACGEPVTVGIDILRSYCDNFVSCPDYAAAEGMRVLSSPLGNDPRIISGESGATGLGMVYEVLTQEHLTEIKQELKIDEKSVLLFINTEGDTDKENYRRIIWDGLYPRKDD